MLGLSGGMRSTECPISYLLYKLLPKNFFRLHTKKLLFSYNLFLNNIFLKINPTVLFFLFLQPVYCIVLHCMPIYFFDFGLL